VAAHGGALCAMPPRTIPRGLAPQRHRAPIGWRTGRFQPTEALAGVLLAKHPSLAFVIPAQPMWAQPPLVPVIDRVHRTFARHRRPDQAINVFYRLDLPLHNIHPFDAARLSWRSSVALNISNTVVLMRQNIT
jgi:hypothetical protein